MGRKFNFNFSHQSPVFRRFSDDGQGHNSRAAFEVCREELGWHFSACPKVYGEADFIK